MVNNIPIDEEYIFDKNIIISQTDLKGKITFANRRFCEVSGYQVDELVGSEHNIVRHPDMPKIIFTKMWDTLNSSQAWNGLVKNLRKDGLYYWVDTEIIPIYNDNKEKTGYIAVRSKASRKDIQESEELYKKILLTQD